MRKILQNADRAPYTEDLYAMGSGGDDDHHCDDNDDDDIDIDVFSSGAEMYVILSLPLQ